MSINRPTSKKRKLINSLLIIALCFVGLLPAHYHLNHGDSIEFEAHQVSHQHVIDLHFITTVHDNQFDNQASIYPASPDTLVKSPVAKSPLVDLLIVILATAVLLLRIVPALLSVNRRYDLRSPIRQLPCLTLPPLRAPPRC